MASNQDDVAGSEDDEDYIELPKTRPDENALRSNRVRCINEHSEKSVRLYKKYMSEKSLVYPMKHLPRGNVIVINNEQLSPPHQRRGTDKDIHKITAIFSQLGFNIIVYNNLKTDVRYKFFIN
ncbi:unnamed protein product [Lymnaea stagnalis]|uniref:Caspase family p20 domain-containing protein n=1 Tax=Lymnaea stagnalis TaxID=6523 RepID=A0AAV2HHK3_LYMST